MSRTLSNPNAGNTIRGKLLVYSGGSNQDTAPLALAAFDGVPASEYNQPSGVAGLDNVGHLPYGIMPAGVSASIGLSGPELLYLSAQGIWTINNYDSVMSYAVTCTAGFVSRNADKIYYTAPSTPGTYGFTINNKVVTVVVDDRYIAKPSIVSPVAEMTNVGAGAVITSSGFSVTGGFLETILTASDKATNDSFSYAIAVTPDGSRLVLGAHGADITGLADAGAVYVFRNDAGSWVQEQKLTASNAQTNAYFGVSIAITPDGSRLAIGTHGYDGAFGDMGAVYVFTRSGTVWAQEQGITAGTPNASGVFGFSVAIDSTGTRIITGSYGATPGGLTQAGSAYIFTRSGTVWTQEALLTASDKAANDAFGGSVAISSSGDRVAISSNNADISSVIDCGAVYTFTRSGTTWTQEQKLSASDKTAYSYFGYSIALSADSATLVVGAYQTTIGSVSNAGAAYVFTRAGTVWTENQKLSASDKAVGDTFGSSVVLSGDGTKILIGANNKDSDNVVNSGGFYIFTKFNGSWMEDTIVSATNKAIGDSSFFKVATTTDGAKILGNSYANDPSGILNAGAAYVYDAAYHASTDWQLSTDAGFTTIVQQSAADTVNRRSWAVTGLTANTNYYVRCRYNGSAYGTSEWSDTTHIKTRQSWLPINEQQILTASDKAASDQFGISIALSADSSRMIVGAYGKTVDGLTACGAVYIYTRSGSSWVQEQMLTASDKAANDIFGYFVSIDSTGTRVLISAHQATITGSAQAGAAYVFTRSGTTWTQEQKLSASDKAASAWFGVSLALDSTGTRAVIGAYGATSGGLSQAGSAYIFTRSGTTWTQEQILFAADRAATSIFGWFVSICADASRVAIGSHYATISGTSMAGAVYIFSRSGTVWTQEQKLSATDYAVQAYFGHDLNISVSGDRLAIGSFNKTVGGLAAAGQVYIYTRSGTVWTLEATISASDKVANGSFGFGMMFNVDATMLLIAANGVNSNQGEAYLFKRVGATWTQEASLTASDKTTGDSYSRFVSLSQNGDVAAISSVGRNSGGVATSGAVYIYR